MSGALATSGLSHRHREPAYYIGDCRISIHSNIELQTRARPYVQSNKYTYSCNNNKCSLFTGVWVLHSWTKTKDQCQYYLQKLHFVSTYLEVVAHNLSSDYS